jgi:hypothetical protein
MRRECRDSVRILLMAAVLASSGLMAGCAGGVRIYDPYHHDYHRWNHTEGTRYQRWEVETHRDHVEFSVRKNDEQQQYWEWRHKH